MPLSRRRFLATVGTATALSPGLLSAADPPLRAAVIGHTGRGDYGHGMENIFKARPGIELVGLADPVEASRTRTAVAIGAPRAYANWRELLDKERPQLVSIAMRHADQHEEIALGCLRAGAHCYVEKPFVRSPDEADVVLAEAEKQGRRIAVAHTMRMTPIVRRLKQALGEGLIGELRELRAFGKQDQRAGGEDLMVLGLHLFDLMRMFVGDPIWCSARVLEQGRDIVPADRRQVKDNVGWVAGDQVSAQFAFAGGVNATFTSDARLRETTGRWGIEFHGSRGVTKLNCDLSPEVSVRSTTGWSSGGRHDDWKPLDDTLVKSAPEHSLAPVSDWLEAIAKQREPECSGRNGAWAVEMVMAVYQAALSGGRVRFPLTMRSHPLQARQ
ncbi:MAG: Gfo/Idh/MocA family oxidoreductase [Pedosphaera sp.]|nr:Gfo/Idh/MocA family oxidoreductase [Pedosphaera sp.]